MSSFEELTGHGVFNDLAESRARWWVVGGAALALHLGRTWRVHSDIDLAVLETDGPSLRDDLRQAASLTALQQVYVANWDGSTGLLVPGDPDLEITISAGTESFWIHRRTQTRVGWNRAVLSGPNEIPYLAPELVLFGKSREPRPHDLVDADEVLGTLTSDARRWLRRRLPPGHRWVAPLRSAR